VGELFVIVHYSDHRFSVVTRCDNDDDVTALEYSTSSAVLSYSVWPGDGVGVFDQLCCSKL